MLNFNYWRIVMAKICEYCQKEHDGAFGSGRFCSPSCSKGYSTLKNRERINQKRSESLKEKHTYLDKVCPVCKKQFKVTQSRGDQECCSLSCASIKRIHENPEQMKQRGSNGGLKSATSQQKRSKNEILFAELCQSYFANTVFNQPIFDG